MQGGRASPGRRGSRCQTAALQTETTAPHSSRPVTSEAASTAHDDPSRAGQPGREPGPRSPGLAALRGLRSAPPLSGPERLQLRRELEQAMAPYPWFTIGVMAPSREIAIAALRGLEAALGWSALQPDASGASLDAARVATPPAPGAAPSSQAEDTAASLERPVFLKGNQRTGLFQLRQEVGLGEGLLISGQEGAAPLASDTWGPLPLDLFR